MTINEKFLPSEAKPMEQWRADLLAAAQYIREHGWCRNAVRNNDGAVCAVGAIDAATGYLYDSNHRNGSGGIPERTKEACSKLAIALNGKYDIEIADWNDDPERTVEEVIAKLEAAALE